jgi:hypothetical protein
MVFTSVDEFGATGSDSIGVFQMLFDGNTGQPPTVCWANAPPDRPNTKSDASTVERNIETVPLMAAAPACSPQHVFRPARRNRRIRWHTPPAHSVRGWRTCACGPPPKLRNHRTGRTSGARRRAAHGSLS